ncbi:hypothetical protein [Bartonella queenslandensis]|uniref:hypothetical protein n=1 Tax=Bartonella queenslandensis TaxID=481138 RepID=UPI0003060F09|nr:hypothetical protein [Bartonella queenslandensis]
MSDEQAHAEAVTGQQTMPQEEVTDKLYDNMGEPEIPLSKPEQEQQEPQKKGEGETKNERKSQENEADQKSSEILGAPENYSFKEFEGADFDPVIENGLKEAARELNLSQAALDKFMDKMVPLALQRQKERMEVFSQEFVTASTNDEEFGGEKLQENLAIAQKAMGQFGSPELKEFLNQSRLGNHPELIRAFYRVGKNMSEDGYVGSSQGAGTGKKTLQDFDSMARAIYDNN